MSMSETEAAKALRGEKNEPAAPKPAPKEEPEALEEEQKPAGPPKRMYKWFDDSNLTVEKWLAGYATADIEVLPGIVFRFHEAKNRELREADAFVNAMGPSFIMRGLVQAGGTREDIPRGDQWARARNIGMLAVTVTHMDGKPWPQGDTFEERFNQIDDLGHVKVDRLLGAMGEFMEQLGWLIRQVDLGNS